MQSLHGPQRRMGNLYILSDNSYNKKCSPSAIYIPAEYRQAQPAVSFSPLTVLGQLRQCIPAHCIQITNSCGMNNNYLFVHTKQLNHELYPNSKNTAIERHSPYSTVL